MMLSMMLEWRGHKVVTAANGMEAYDLASSHSPWLIILDLMMPVMSGEEFRKAQLASKQLRKIPVLVISAHHDALKIAKRLKVDGCIRKPVDFDELDAFIARRH